MNCSGHLIATADHHNNGTVTVTLWDGTVKQAKSDRGAMRIMDNASKKRGPCNCLNNKETK
jgi:hypothetical protein